MWHDKDLLLVSDSTHRTPILQPFSGKSLYLSNLHVCYIYCVIYKYKWIGTLRVQMFTKKPWLDVKQQSINLILSCTLTISSPSTFISFSRWSRSFVVSVMMSCHCSKPSKTTIVTTKHNQKLQITIQLYRRVYINSAPVLQSLILSLWIKNAKQNQSNTIHIIAN